MAIRLFRRRQPKTKRQDPTRLAAGSQPVRKVKVVRAAVRREPAIIDTVISDGGKDPYNSTGRILADKVRFRRYD